MQKNVRRFVQSRVTQKLYTLTCSIVYALTTVFKHSNMLDFKRKMKKTNRIFYPFIV